MLLQTLWLLLLASLLASVAMALSLSNARDGAAALASLRVETAAESAVHRVLYDLVTGGRQSVWLQRSQTSPLTLDGMQVAVTVQDVSGLLDLNASDESTLRRLTAALGLSESDKVVAAINASKPIVSYATLAALDGMSHETLEALSPHITLFSRQALPSADNASEWLAGVLRLEKTRQSILVDSSSISGRVFKIVATATDKDVSSPMLSAEILLTGRNDQPFLVYDWSWHPRNAVP